MNSKHCVSEQPVIKLHNVMKQNPNNTTPLFIDWLDLYRSLKLFLTLLCEPVVTDTSSGAIRRIVPSVRAFILATGMVKISVQARTQAREWTRASRGKPSSSQTYVLNRRYSLNCLELLICTALQDISLRQCASLQQYEDSADGGAHPVGGSSRGGHLRVWGLCGGRQ